MVEQRRGFREEQRQVILDAAGIDAIRDVLVERDARGVAFEGRAEALAEGGAAGFVRGKLARRQQADFRHWIEAALTIDVESAQGLDQIVEQLDPIGQRAAHRKQVDQSAAQAVFARRHDLADRLVAGGAHLLAEALQIEPLAAFEQKGMGGEESRREKSGGGGRGGGDQHVALPLRDGEQRREPLGDQVLMRREMIPRQRFPVGQEMHRQARREPADFLGQPLRIERRGGDDGERAASGGELGNREGVAGDGELGKRNALAWLARGKGREQGAHGSRGRDYRISRGWKERKGNYARAFSP
jgi:hypothetical protein